MHSHSCPEFLSSNDPILDVRSPSEFASGHIPAALNFPLFSDEERAAVGTLYKNEGRETAIKKGLEFVGPKMRGFIEAAEKIGGTSFRMHCWRGGMRSQSMAWLLESYGFQVSLLKGGYKAYRSAMHDFFSQDLDLRVLTGHTGSQKTEILLAMRALGAQVLDLEGAAGHQGSSFGNVLSQGQPSTEHFHNLLYEEARYFDCSKPIWVEDESYMIGRVALVSSLYGIKEKSAHYHIQIPDEARLDHLVKGYGEVHKKGLISATEGIRKKLGNERADEAIGFIQEGRLREAAQIALHYYDKQYQRALDNKKALIKEEYIFDHGDIQRIAQHVLHGNT